MYLKRYYSIINKTNYISSYYSRVVNAFIVYEWQKIVIFFLKQVDVDFINAQYCLDFYNYDLEFQNEVIIITLIIELKKS